MAGYHVRAFVKLGITGLAQVRGFRGEARDNSDIQNRVACDLEYPGELEPFAGDRNYPEDGCATVPAAADRVLRFFFGGTSAVSSLIFGTIDTIVALLLQQFARFCHREKFIEPMQPCKVIAFRAIEKTLLPHVNVEKSQQWAKWQMPRKGFEFSAPVDRSAADFP